MKYNCPQCFANGEKVNLMDKSTREMIPLLLPSQHTLIQMMGAGLEKGRGQWRECPRCGFAGLYRIN